MKGSGFIASENDLFVLSPTADKAGEAPACDFPALPLAQALHLGEAGATEGGQAHEQKKKATKSGAHHSGKCCFYRSLSIRAQTQLMCSISTTEPSSEGNVNRLEVGRWRSPVPRVDLQQPPSGISDASGQPIQASFTWKKRFFCQPVPLLRAPQTLLTPTCGTQGSSSTFTQPPVPPEYPALGPAVWKQNK